VARSRAILTALLIVGAVAAIALTRPLGSDYPGPTCSVCDYAGPPIEALAHGHVATFFHEQPVMGSFSLLLRAPAAVIAHSVLLEYRLGALACLLIVGLLAWVLTRIMERDGKNWLAQLLVAGICVAGPMTFAALRWGHPEELLGGALCVGAVLLAAYRRPVAAGLVLGCALATKPWAILAVIPVLAVARERRLALLGTAVGSAAVLTLPMLLGDPARFWRMAHIYGVAGTGVTPPDIWWSYGHEGGILITPHGVQLQYVVPAWVWSVAHPLAVVLGAAVAAGYWRMAAKSGSGVSLSRALEVLALALLLRCVLDPTDYSYYHSPFLIALAASEAVGPRRYPYAAAVSAAALQLLTYAAPPHHGPGTLSVAYLVWALATTAYLAGDLFAGESVVQQLRGALSRETHPASAA
jgi:hypothetical protein